MDFSALRTHYPATAKQTYLNTASCGVISQATARVAQQFYQDFLERGGSPRTDWYEQLATVRQEVAAWLRAETDELGLLPNFSVGHNYVVRALSPFRRVLLMEGDYGSVTFPWLLTHPERYYFSAEANGRVDINRVEQKIKEHRIEVLAISHVQYDTGFCIDLEALAQNCRDWGVLLVVDATQSLGVVPIDLQRAPVDILIASGYKWMAAGFGNALLYVRRDRHEQLAVPAVGNHSFVGFPDIRSRDEVGFSLPVLEVGHCDFSSFFALQQAVRELRTLGADAICQRVQTLTRYLYDQLPPTIRVVSDYPERNRSGITVIEGDLSLEKKLLKYNVVTSARGRGLRISLHHYNNRADVDRLCEVLAEIK